MQLIRNAYQAIKYHIACTKDEQLERRIASMQLGKTDAERNEELRNKRHLRNFWTAIVVAVVSMYIVGALS